MIKKFENYMSREEMCRVLCRNGYEMHELEECSNQELEEMCKGCNDHEEDNEAYESKSEKWMSRQEMCRVLCRNGYEMHELEECSNQELEEMCKGCNDHEDNEAYEAKSEKWIQDAIKRPGALRKKLGKKGDEKISSSEINKELSELKSKDKDKDKKGVQGLSKKDLTKFRQLNLAKTLKGLKENCGETSNYMFFGNLKTIKRLVDEMLEMDEAKVDAMLSDGHNWAVDHIATSKDDVEEVFNFLAGHDVPTEDHGHASFDVDGYEPSHEETEGHLANKDLEEEMKGIKSFNDFKK